MTIRATHTDNAMDGRSQSETDARADYSGAVFRCECCRAVRRFVFLVVLAAASQSSIAGNEEGLPSAGSTVTGTETSDESNELVLLPVESSENHQLRPVPESRAFEETGWTSQLRLNSNWLISASSSPDQSAGQTTDNRFVQPALYRPDDSVQTSVAASANSDSATPFFDLSKSEEADSPALSAPDKAAGGTSEQIARMMAWMIILMCLFCLTILGLRKWQRSRGLLPSTNGQSKVLETLSLGPGKSVSLIEMRGMRAFVGLDAGGIRSIVPAPRSFEDELSSESADNVS